MAARKSILRPWADKQVKAPEAAKAAEPVTASRTIPVKSVGSVLIRNGGALIIADGKTEDVKCKRVSLTIEG